LFGPVGFLALGQIHVIAIMSRAFKDGVLTVHLVKTEPAKSKQIEVKVA
jgi:hypothetical protein